MKKKRSGSNLNKILFVVIGLFIITLVVVSFRKNIHVVIKNQVYRSAQLSDSTLTSLVKNNGIHTIINLRGKNPHLKWYNNEMKVSQHIKVAHYDIALNAEKLPSKAQMLRLIDLLEHTKRPLLLHCQTGADRTGLASAVALILIKNASIADAKRACSWRYLVTSDKSIGKQVLRRYQAWVENTGKKASRSQFLLWIKTSYPNTKIS